MGAPENATSLVDGTVKQIMKTVLVVILPIYNVIIILGLRKIVYKEDGPQKDRCMIER